MAILLSGMGLLIAAYFIYGAILDRAVLIDPRRATPAQSLADGVDYVALPTWRIYLIQLLNIAGLGPIFGPILGALWGPGVLLWVVLGSIFGGAVHDYIAGVMSERKDGAGLPDLIGSYLGIPVRHLATVFILMLLILVGTVFVKGPAGLVVELVPAASLGSWLNPEIASLLATTWQGSSLWLWLVMGIIFVYYLLATLLPIDRLIGLIYPFFGLCLLAMACGLIWALLSGDITVAQFTVHNQHPAAIPAWPIIFVTVSCGAISGFHATQSPLMARCLKNERNMRLAFYGAMLTEGAIAMVWALAAGGFYGDTVGLAKALGPSQNPAPVVREICVGTMGNWGGLLAMIGVVILPITSGDTAFRAARLIAADYFGLPQRKVLNRYLIALPMFAAAFALNFIPFEIIWRYFGWANQTLAAITLWACSLYLAERGRWWWLTLPPAIFMTTMTTTYILVENNANGGFGLNRAVGTIIGLGIGAVSLATFIHAKNKPAPQG